MHAGDVSHDHFGAEGAVGDDIGDAGVAVFLADVVDDLDAAAHAEVYIEVGRGDALGVEEALEKETETDGIDVGNPEQVGDEAAGARTAPGSDGDLVFAGPIDEVPDDEEIVVEACDGDDGQLVAGAQDKQFVGGEGGVVGRGGLLAGGEVGELGKALGDDGVSGDGGVVVAVAGSEAPDTQVEQVG